MLSHITTFKAVNGYVNYHLKRSTVSGHKVATCTGIDGKDWKCAPKHGNSSKCSIRLLIKIVWTLKNTRLIFFFDLQ